MIIKGGSRGAGVALGRYLQSVGANERVTVLEIKGTVAQDIIGALKEMEAYAEGTKCEKSFYHAQVNPEPPYRLTPEQVFESIDLLEKELGLEGHARVVVMHEKDGRQHYHPVWTRIDLENMRAVPDSHNFAAHERVARELERHFDHPRVQGAHAEREGAERPDRSPSRAELAQEKRTGIKGKEVREEVTALFKGSDGAEAFANALEDNGYVLAKGDKRDFVIIDRAGGEHSLARRISGVRAAELREFMAPIDRESLPTVEEAKDIVQDRNAGASAFDEKCWEDALATSAIETELHNEKQPALDKAENAQSIAWEDALAANAIEKAKADEEERKRLAREALAQALIEKDYARSDSYVNQAQTAQKDFERRKKALAEIPAPMHPEHHAERAIENRFESAKEGVTDRSAPSASGERAEDNTPSGEIGNAATDKDHIGNKADADPRYERMLRLLDGAAARAAPEYEIDPGRTASERETGGGIQREGEHEPVSDKFQSMEMTDQRYSRMQRLLDSGRSDEREERDDDPGRQPEVPGGGRTGGR